jgi:CNP1-like family protein
MKAISLILCVLLAAACASKEFKDQFDNEKTWAELQTQLPEYPSQNNLLPFDTGPSSNDQHFVDATSIQVGEDGVMRYSLVIKSPSGAMNVTFEGMRCSTNERKLYALGRNDGEWTHSHNADWQRLDNVRQLDAQRELAKYYFCPLKSIVKTRKEAINALKAGIHPRVKLLYQ